MNDRRIIIFGEVLFDVFPDGAKILGGAPFNVAWHLRAFGLDPLMITRVGQDAEGEEVLAAMAEWRMNTSGVQTDPLLPTGRVAVRFDAGEPQYTILHPSAFDAIDYPPAKIPAESAPALLYHGSLALRSLASREALEQLRHHHSGLTFIDVNLRPPWWKRDDVLQWVESADWVKLNKNELQHLSGTSGAVQDQAAWFLNEHGLSGVILTQGDQGACLLTAEPDTFQVRPGNAGGVVDTVGAGDAFTSVMLLGLVNQWTPELTLGRAQQFASLLCGQRGAIVRNEGFYQPLIEDWKL